MLGLSDRARTIDLFEALMRGEIAQALEEFEAQRALGSDPYVILSDLAEFVHWVTRLKVLPESADDAARSQAERERGVLSSPANSPWRAWRAPGRCCSRVCRK
jgi:DNA polymerase III subunit gamma/tau